MKEKKTPETIKITQYSLCTYLCVVIPRSIAKLHRRHKYIGLHPTDKQFFTRQEGVVTVTFFCKTEKNY